MSSKSAVEGWSKKRSFRRARFSPAARNCPAILSPRNLGGDSAPHALGNMPSACWFTALTAWLRHERNDKDGWKNWLAKENPMNGGTMDDVVVMGQKATRRWKINQFDKKQGACKSYIQLI